jgi:serine/threonine protein kinase
MPLSLGVRLGPYEILDALGAGGMGEVYRARDTRLERTVAIKVLPAELSSNVDRKQRFEREARTISSLNHPNICGLYDVGSQDGLEFLVLEYVEGETLEKRLESGPLPTEVLMRHGLEIADALEKAHRTGVIHRDLKPCEYHADKIRRETAGFWAGEMERSAGGARCAGSSGAPVYVTVLRCGPSEDRIARGARPLLGEDYREWAFSWHKTAIPRMPRLSEFDGLKIFIIRHRIYEIEYLVRTGFSSPGRIVAFPAKRPLAQLLPSGQCAQRPMFAELNISPVKRACEERC